MSFATDTVAVRSMTMTLTVPREREHGEHYWIRLSEGWVMAQWDMPRGKPCRWRLIGQASRVHPRDVREVLGPITRPDVF